ncbi:MAG: transglycosylase domain-containing protein [Actinomycetota bacterium]
MPRPTPDQSEHEARPGRVPYFKIANLVLGLVVAWVAADYIVEYALAKVPLPQDVKLPTSSQVYDREGRLIATYRGEVTRILVDIDDVPEHVKNAVIAAEDRDFYEHEGISIGGMARAAWTNLTSGRVEQGGSTITQQYVKNAVLNDPSRTIERKLKEAILSIKLEREYSKEEILGFYLNTVYFGRGAYGIEAAARAYFGKHMNELTLAEAAYLAGVIPAPALYQPGEGGDAAAERRNYVLRAMEAEGFISEAQMDKAASRKIRFNVTSDMNRKKQPAAYFLEWLRKEYLYPRFGERLYTGGLKIHTTLDLDMQRAAEQAISAYLTEKEHPQAALVSMTPSGEVRALVGGRNFTDISSARGFNYATDGVRQAGSSFKPFTLLAAIEENISLSSYISGESPKTIDDPACAGPDGIWEPENYGGSSYGSIDLNTATANSVNTVYAELIAEIGPDKVADLLERFGFTTPTEDGEIPAHCSLSLGTLDVSVLQMARAYAGLAARGQLPEVTPITKIEDSEGNCILGYGTPKKAGCKKRVETDPELVTEANNVDVLTQSLTGVIENGTGTAAQIGRPVAGKTGTTQDNRDAWFAGYVPQMATVVWMGYPIEKGPDKEAGTADDISPLMQSCYELDRCRPVNGIDVTGGSFPAEIWATFMSVALEGVDILDFPYPIDTPDIVLNPPPPPPPEPEEREEPPGQAEGGPPGQEKEKEKE